VSRKSVGSQVGFPTLHGERWGWFLQKPKFKPHCMHEFILGAGQWFGISSFYLFFFHRMKDLCIALSIEASNNIKNSTRMGFETFKAKIRTINTPISMGMKWQIRIACKNQCPSSSCYYNSHNFWKTLIVCTILKIRSWLWSHFKGFDLIPRIKYEVAYCAYNHQVKTSY
jgi:hypothetical protein